MLKPTGAKGGLILAGIAAFAYYKYSKMSEEEKRSLVSNLKQQGQKLYDQYIPEEIKSMLGKKTTANTESKFGEGSAYTG